MILKRLKIFIAVFSIIFLLIAFILPCFNQYEYYAATVSKTETSRRPVGHKVAGAEYYEELWEKYSVIAVDNGGGMGGGGGAGDSNAFNAGNSGNYNDAGGTFGQVAGVGLGTGNQANLAGEGSGRKGLTTGSSIADALRTLRAEIDESRAESMAKVLESAIDASITASSIEESESIRASVQKRLQQERVKARITAVETAKQFETPVYIEETARIQRTVENTVETNSPTSRAAEPTFYDNNNRIVEEETIATSEYEPGDLVETTVRRNQITIDASALVERPTNVAESRYVEDITTPTSEDLNEDVESLTPTSDNAAVAVENLMPTAEDSADATDDITPTPEEQETFESEIVESAAETQPSENVDNNEVASDKEEGAGSKGGQDAEADEDMTGDDGVNESVGNADEHGQFQLETQGNNSGKKIFELDRTGNIGLDPEHLSVTNMKGMMLALITMLISIGALVFIFNSRDRKEKKNYF